MNTKKIKNSSGVIIITLLLLLIFLNINTLSAQSFFTGQKIDSVTSLSGQTTKSLNLDGNVGIKSVTVINRDTNTILVSFGDTTQFAPVFANERATFPNTSSGTITLKGVASKIYIFTRYGIGPGINYNLPSGTKLNTANIPALNSSNTYTNTNKYGDTTIHFNVGRINNSYYSKIWRDSINNQLVIDDTPFGSDKYLKLLSGNSNNQIVFIGGTLNNGSGLRLLMNQSGGSASIYNWYSSSLYSHLDLGGNRTTLLRLTADQKALFGSTTDNSPKVQITSNTLAQLGIYHNSTNGITFSSNSDGTITFNSLQAGGHILFNMNGGFRYGMYSTGFLPASTLSLGGSGNRWGLSYFNNNLDILWATNIDFKIIRGTVDTDITGFTARTPNGTLKYCYINDSGVLVIQDSAF